MRLATLPCMSHSSWTCVRSVGQCEQVHVSVHVTQQLDLCVKCGSVRTRSHQRACHTAAGSVCEVWSVRTLLNQRACHTAAGPVCEMWVSANTCMSHSSWTCVCSVGQCEHFHISVHVTQQLDLCVKCGPVRTLLHQRACHTEAGPVCEVRVRVNTFTSACMSHRSWTCV